MTGQWWAIHSSELIGMLRRVEAGEEPELVYAEAYANAEVTSDPLTAAPDASTMTPGGTTMAQVSALHAQIYKVPKGWRWRVVGNNNEIMAQGESYSTKWNTKRALRRLFPGIDIQVMPLSF